MSVLSRDATSIKECTEQKEVVTASGRTQIQWLVREVYYFTSFFFLLQSKVKGSSWNSLHCDNMFADQRCKFGLSLICCNITTLSG